MGILKMTASAKAKPKKKLKKATTKSFDSITASKEKAQDTQNLEVKEISTSTAAQMKLSTQEVRSPHEIISANINTPKIFVLLSIISTLFYFTWWLNINNMGNPFLYMLLFIGEVYHIWQALGYAITVWDQSKQKHTPVKVPYPVDIFITVCGEPVEIVEKTVQAALNIDYPDFKVYVLNDACQYDSERWHAINNRTKELGATPITRPVNSGAKAGNVNNALENTQAPFIAIFDADHIPHPEFLQKTMGHFQNENLALVQTPQYYKNRGDSYLTTAAWEQQELFFGPICRGKNQLNATFWCGTNAVIRRKALDDIGGVPVNNIAEDFLASFKMHEKGWETLYVAEILAEGLAPHDLANYVSQQFRWARGSSEILLKHNVIFNKNLTIWQKIQYLYSSSYYLNGFIALIDALVPIVVLLTGIVPVNDSTSSFMLYFFPFIFSTIHLLMLSTENTITFRAIQLSMSSSFVFIRAVLSTALGINSKFTVTSKEASSGNFLRMAAPNILYVVLGFVVIGYALATEGFVPSVVTNASWIIFNMILFGGFIRVAYPWEQLYLKVLRVLRQEFALYKKNLKNRSRTSIFARVISFVHNR